MIDIIKCPDGEYELTRHYGKPVIGGVKYNRISTVAGCLDDKTPLMYWRSRTALRGLRENQSLLDRLNAAVDDADYAAIEKDAFEWGGGYKAASDGTNLHSYIFQCLFEGLKTSEVPERYRGHVIEFLDATRMFKFLAGERFVVNPGLCVAGSLDYLCEFEGEIVVCDLKTGASDNKYVKKPATQICLYSSSQVLSASGDFHDLTWGLDSVCRFNPDRGFLFHLPFINPFAMCEVIELNLSQVRERAELAAKVSLL